MTSTTVRTGPEAAAARRDALASRLMSAGTEALELLHVHIGDRLGLYRAIAERGPLDAAGLATAAGVAERYAQEWLEQQAVCGILELVGSRDDRHLFALPAGHAEVLLDANSLHHLAPLAGGVASVARTLPAVLDAFQTGAGVPYSRYGPDLRWSTARLSRPRFLRQLGHDWIPAALPDIDLRLRTDPSARIADVGCGTGWSAIGLAVAYPKAHVAGFDTDEASIAEARIHAVAQDVASRVTFHAHDVETVARSSDATFDLVCAFHAVHAMADPAGALRAMRAMLATGGTLLVADAKVAETFTPPGDDLERFHYAWSAVCSLPCGLKRRPGLDAGAEAGTGAVLRAATLRSYAADARFPDVAILPIDHPSWRFYRLTAG